MPDTFSVTASFDKASYNAGDKITATITGGDVLTQTTTTNETVGPITIPIVAADGSTSTVAVPSVQVAVTTTTTTPESVVIDTTQPIVDNGTPARVWVVAANKLSISSTA